VHGPFKKLVLVSVPLKAVLGSVLECLNAEYTQTLKLQHLF